MENEKIHLPPRRSNEIMNNFDNASVVITPELEHDIYISPALDRKLKAIIAEINGRKNLGYLAGRGAVLSGFQGCGKTTLAKKLAQMLSVEEIYCIDKEMPNGRISATFGEAKEKAEAGKNVFVLIDEIDSFGQKEYARFSGGLSKIVVLMQELDSIGQFCPKGVYYVLATTNYLENIEDRLLRPGRLEEIIEVPLPDLKAREAILKIHQDNSSINPHRYTLDNEVITFMAAKSNGYTPADLRSLVKHACINAEYRGKKKISSEDAENAAQEFVTSVKRGLDWFAEPMFNLEEIVGREAYKNFFDQILKQDEAKCLLYGPKGVGKTMFPEALAKEYEFNFIFARGSELQEGIVGEGTKKLKKLFQRAALAAPCIVCFDEIKGMITARNTLSHKDDETAYLNSLLSRPIQGVYVFATTNNPLELNETTLSRFESKVYLDLPNLDERKLYLEKRLNGQIGEYLNELVLKTEGHSFRDLKNVGRILKRIETIERSRKIERGKLIDYVLTEYVPENNRDDELNGTTWEGIKNYVGDNVEIEKFVCDLSGDKK